jgi:DNA phosphorothioation-dependent restriction protein DptH
MIEAEPVLVPATADDVYALLAKEVLVQVRSALETAEEGQRLRLTTLPGPVMDELCRLLQGDRRWITRVLAVTASGHPWTATATKLIELRNTLREPLLVFIPPGLRTAAEDSLDIATFTELSLSALPSHLVEVLIPRLPDEVQPTVRETLEFLRLQKAIRNPDDSVRYLLTVLKNGGTREAVGGALFVFGLVPDFALCARGQIPYWLSRNLLARQMLGDLRQPVQHRVSALPLAPNSVQAALFEFLRNHHAQDPREWTPDIACDPRHHHLAFDRWRFIDQPGANEVRLIIERLGLPIQAPDQVGGAVQLPVLDLQGGPGLKLSFRSLPPPAQVAAWRTYRIQILRLDPDHPTVVWESNSYQKPAGRNRTISRGIRTAELRGLEEGTYFAKVDAYDHNGALLTQTQPVDPANEAGRRENESDPFLIVHEGAAVEPVSARAVNVASLGQGWVLAAMRALGGSRKDSLPADLGDATGAWQEPRGALARGTVHFPLEGSGLEGYAVVMPAILRRLEFEILEHPDTTGTFRLDLRRAPAADAEIEHRGPEAGPDTPAFRAFIAARRDVFERVLRQHAARGADDDSLRRLSVVETADLIDLSELIEAYGQAFVALVEEAASPAATASGLARLLADLDQVEVRWRPSAGDPGRALLLAPTHPLRLLWHLQHVTQCVGAIESWHDQSHEVPSWKLFVDQLRLGLLPVNLPTAILDSRGFGQVEREPLTSHWALYLPDRGAHDEVLDVAACRDAVRRHLGIGRLVTGEPVIGAHDVAVRIFDYLFQHPYVEHLRLNVFNPGDGDLLADALREVERLRLSITPGREAPTLRYSVQMFASQEHLDNLGDAFERLLDPDRQVGEDDEFTLASADHLRPKLVFGRHAIEEFLQQPGAFPAHLSIFIEHFAVRIQLGAVERFRRGSYVEGLVQEPETLRDAGPSRFGWSKGLRAEPRPVSDSREQLLSSCLQATQRVQAAAAMGQPADGSSVPIVALRLDLEAQALLTQAHATSDWVLTVDRNLGLDFFDSPARSADSAYLLDYAPEYIQEDRQRIMLTTRSTLEVERVVRPALERFGLPMEPGDELVVLESLRSLSGRVALRLLATPTQSSEVVGLLLARWLLEHAGLLEDRIIIPIDAHRQWFLTSDSFEGVLPRRRADLLLVKLDTDRATVDVTIVEIKMREDQGSGRARLYAEMKEQADATEERVRELFDPERFTRPRADFSLQAKELISVLSFYVRRAARYRLLSTETESVTLDFVSRLDAGYHLVMRTLGILFEPTTIGSHVDLDEPGFPVHRFGLDSARILLASARAAVQVQTRRGGLDDTDVTLMEQPAGMERTVVREAVFEALAGAVGGRTTRAALRGTAAPRDSSPLTEPEKHFVGAVSNRGAGTISSPPVQQRPGGAVEQQPAPAEIQPSATEGALMTPDVLLGATEMTPQYGLIGRFGGATVGLDLTGCNTISLFGVQGFGKSYTLGVIAEMATTPVSGINVLPAPLATVIFHYHKSDAYSPEYAAAIAPNQKRREIEHLLTEYGARPRGLEDVTLLTPEAKLQQRQREFPGLDVRPLKFASSEIGAESWKFLLGAYGNESLYIRQLVAIMRQHRGALTLERLKQDLAAAPLSASSRSLADQRITFAEPYIDDAAPLGNLLRPGRTVIVDLRDEWVEKEEALGLFVVLLRIFSASRYEDREFNKLVVFDEAHKYITESELIGQVVETIREMRHQATSVLIASQDPLSVPRTVIELTSILMLHRMTSPQWLRHLKGAITALEDLSEGHVASLQPGEALVWAQRSTDRRFSQRPQKVQIRPRFTQHGGGTRTAVSGVTVR